MSNTTLTPEYVDSLWYALPDSQREYQVENHFNYPKPYFPGFYNTVLRSVADDLIKVHPYLAREQDKYCLSPVIYELLHAGHQPCDFRALALEWPHTSVTDPQRIAYTRNVSHGEQDRQTVTNLGKYLRRHFDLPDHVIRDIVAANAPVEVKITYDKEEMIRIVTSGPASCMSYDFADLSAHPYEVYDPSYGWGMAYMEDEEGKVIARALIYEGVARGEEHKCYVRTYSGKDSNGFTQRSEGMEHKLQEMGYKSVCGWPEGAKLARIEDGGTYIMPYLDGCNDHVDDCGHYFEITYSCGMDATSSAGYIEDLENCENCHELYSRGDLHSVGRHDDTQVCEGCLNYYYVYTVGEYYEHEDEVIQTECGDYIPKDELDDYDVVVVGGGYFGHRYFYADDCVDVLDIGWVPEDELDEAGVVMLDREYQGYLHAHEDDVVQLRSGGFLHMDDTDGYVEVDGEWVPESELTDEDREVLEEAA